MKTKEEIGLEITRLNVKLFRHIKTLGWDNEAEKIDEKIKTLKWVLGLKERRQEMKKREVENKLYDGG